MGWHVGGDATVEGFDLAEGFAGQTAGLREHRNGTRHVQACSTKQKRGHALFASDQAGWLRRGVHSSDPGQGSSQGFFGSVGFDEGGGLFHERFSHFDWNAAHVFGGVARGGHADIAGLRRVTALEEHARFMLEGAQ